RPQFRAGFEVRLIQIRRSSAHPIERLGQPLYGGLQDRRETTIGAMAIRDEQIELASIHGLSTVLARRSFALLLPDDDEPCGDDRSLRTAATPASWRRWRRVGRGRRSGTALGLEEVHVVSRRIDGDGLGSRERR